MKIRIPRIFPAALSCLTFGVVCPSFAIEKEPTAIKQPALDWKQVDGVVTGEDFVPLPSNAAKERGTSSLKLRKADGSKIASPRILDPKIFFSSHIFSADLPVEIRQQPTFVRILVQATAKEDPELGTVLNIDGAIIGFKARTRDGGAYAADLVAAVDFMDGKRVWAPVGVCMSVNQDSKLTGSPPLCAKIDWANKTWAIFVDDILVREGLPLFPAADESSKIKIRAGSSVGDMALLNDLAYSDHPHPRVDNPVKVGSDGKLDLEAAFRAGVAHIQRSGETNK